MHNLLERIHFLEDPESFNYFYGTSLIELIIIRVSFQPMYQHSMMRPT